MGELNRLNLTVIVPCVYRRLVAIRQCVQNLILEGFDGCVLLMNRDQQPMSPADVVGNVSLPFKLDVVNVDGGRSFYDRLMEGTNLAQTDYVCLHPEDDLMFVDVLREAVAFLDANSDYVYAHGKSVRVSITANGKVFYGPYQFLPFGDADPFKRFRALMSSFNQHFWGVMRTSSLREKARNAMRWFDDDVMFNQYFDSVETVLQGKVHVVNRIGLIRFIDEKNGGVQLAKHGNYDHFPWLILAEDFTFKYHRFMNAVKTRLKELRVLDYDIAAFERANISIVMWGLCQKRANNSDLEFVPKLLQLNPSELEKLNRSVGILRERREKENGLWFEQERWGASEAHNQDVPRGQA